MSPQEIKDLIRWLQAQLPKAKPPKPKPGKLPFRTYHPAFGIDYAWGNPRLSALRTVGASFVCRYLSTPGNTKNLRRGEARALRAARFDIVTVFETTAERALSGFSAGVEDARSAKAQLAAIGAPANCPMYFAVDFDETPSQASAVAQYFKGASHILGKHLTGAYGGYWTLKRLFDAGVIRYGWQTYAWSGGAWEHRAQLRQFSNSHLVDGVDCDFNRSLVEDFGQWPR